MSETATTALIEVIDDRPGVPELDRDRIFERFVRLDQSRARDSGGSGLGLPIARQIAGAHGRDLMVGHHEGGTRFTLSIPRVRPA